jgi:protein-S-isoprenylcysteine O-methyltransferase Ste14
VALAADLVILAAWLVVVGHNLLLAARGVQRAPERRRWIIGILLAGALVGAGAWLERASGGRLDAPSWLVAAGVIAAAGGALLHVAARARLGAVWSARPDAPPRLVEDGPYGVVRHPLYLALVLLAVGTMAAHPSLPTFAGGAGLLAGLAAKITREERALASAFGPRWEEYRRRVPRLVPRRSRR